MLCQTYTTWPKALYVYHKSLQLGGKQSLLPFLKAGLRFQFWIKQQRNIINNIGSTYIIINIITITCTFQIKSILVFALVLTSFWNLVSSMPSKGQISYFWPKESHTPNSYSWKLKLKKNQNLKIKKMTNIMICFCLPVMKFWVLRKWSGRQSVHKRPLFLLFVTKIVTGFLI